MQRNVENFIGCESSYQDAKIVLFGAPFDSTTSFRPGARFGPAAMRHESFGLETYSPYQDKDLEDLAVFDSGDLELCFGSSEMALADIEARAREIVSDGKFPLLLGRRTSGHIGQLSVLFWKNIRSFTSYISMLMQTCAMTISAHSSAMPVSCAAVMI